MSARWRLVFSAGLLGPLAMLAGCTSDDFVVEPVGYEEQPTMTREVEGKASLADKPAIQEKVRKALARVFGDTPQTIVVPEGAPLSVGHDGRLGLRLANYVMTDEGPERIRIPGPDGGLVKQVGGYGLYKANCLQCHGISGGGDGPAGQFFLPRPRDFRPGVFKFTSTASGARPTRDDLRRTIRHGMPGTSMPAYDVLFSDEEIEQLVDYVTFLTVRGETELALIEEGSFADDEDEDALEDDLVDEIVQGVFERWKTAEESVVEPPIPQPPATAESIQRGRELYLGETKEKLECAGCHGATGHGDGPSVISMDIYNKVVYGGELGAIDERVEELDEATRDLWVKSLDAWGNPLRPANLNNGAGTIYKGGNQPVDIYRRIAKGINGTQMPAHYPAIDAEQIWDLVNFVLALPEQPDLLKEEASPSPAEPAPAPAVSLR